MRRCVSHTDDDDAKGDDCIMSESCVVLCGILSSDLLWKGLPVPGESPCCGTTRIINPVATSHVGILAVSCACGPKFRVAHRRKLRERENTAPQKKTNAINLQIPNSLSTVACYRQFRYNLPTRNRGNHVPYHKRVCETSIIY